MNKSKKVTLIASVILFLMLIFFIGALSASAVPPPLRIEIYPDTIYFIPPRCLASFVATVESDYKDRPIQIMFDFWSEGDWPAPPYTPYTGTFPLLRSAYFDGRGGNMPVGTDYQTVITLISNDLPSIGDGTYRVRVYAFPEGTDPYQYGVYKVLTCVFANTEGKCDPDYWPPPPSDEDSDIITDWDEDWPPPFDDATDIITDNTDGWRWWRWWKFDWKWWRYPDQGWWGNWWYRWWPWANGEDRETEKSFDFSLTVTPSLQSIEPGESADFAVKVDYLSGDSQTVSLSLSGLPTGAASSFSVPSAGPTFSSSLSITTEPALPPGTYPFTVTGNGGGKTHSVIVNLIVDEGREKTLLSVSVNPPAAKKDETVSVSGALSPPIVVPIELIYTRPDGFEMTKQVTTSPEGLFSDSFAPDLSGIWSIRARWIGDDQYFGSESQPATLSVEAAAEQPAVWEIIFGILTLLILIAVIVAIIYLLIRRKRRSKEGKLMQAAVNANYCTQCGASIPEGAKFCPQCGDKTSRRLS